jgi:hypothetical protein
MPGMNMINILDDLLQKRCTEEQGKARANLVWRAQRRKICSQCTKTLTPEATVIVDTCEDTHTLCAECWPRFRDATLAAHLDGVTIYTWDGIERIPVRE